MSNAGGGSTTYSVWTRCDNCNVRGYLVIEKGTPVPAEVLKCGGCGCDAAFPTGSPLAMSDIHRADVARVIEDMLDGVREGRRKARTLVLDEPGAPAATGAPDGASTGSPATETPGTPGPAGASPGRARLTALPLPEQPAPATLALVAARSQEHWRRVGPPSESRSPAASGPGTTSAPDGATPTASPGPPGSEGASAQTSAPRPLSTAQPTPAIAEAQGAPVLRLLATAAPPTTTLPLRDPGETPPPPSLPTDPSSPP